jgi:hypothetical protein
VGPLTIGIDANPAGNTATSLGTINGCRDTTAGQAVDIDIYIQDVTSMISWGFPLRYTGSVANVTGVTLTGLFQDVVGAPNSAIFNTSDATLPDSDGIYTVGAIDTGNLSGDSGTGVLARVTLQAVANGVSSLRIDSFDLDGNTVLDYGPFLTDSTGAHPGDTNGDSFFDSPSGGVITNATLAVGQPDTDGDGASNACDTDDDGDGILDTSDNCPTNANASQADMDADAWGDACDNDVDGDGFLGTTETNKGANDLVAARLVEVCDATDNDGDTQIDEGYDLNGNTTPDCSEAVDTDGDTVPNTTDTDDDGDGSIDTREAWMGTDSLDKCSDTVSNPWGAPTDDAWPFDFDQSHTVNVIDVLRFRPVLLTLLGGHLYDRRFDLNADHAINVLDILVMKPKILTSCT